MSKTISVANSDGGTYTVDASSFGPISKTYSSGWFSGTAISSTTPPFVVSTSVSSSSRPATWTYRSGHGRSSLPAEEQEAIVDAVLDEMVRDREGVLARREGRLAFEPAGMSPFIVPSWPTTSTTSTVTFTPTYDET